MLKRIYVNNYKSLVNFELLPGEISLFLGPNGAGKSAVFEVLRKLQDFVGGRGRVTDLFDPASQTRWQSSRLQSFEMEIEGNEGLYRYGLSVEHDEEGREAWVNGERLWFNNALLVKFDRGDVQLYHDDHSPGASYPFDRSLSAVASIPPRSDTTRLAWFKEQLRCLIIVQIIPALMSELSAREEEQPAFKFENYISWYRSVSQDQGVANLFTNELREILPGFDYFRFTGDKQRRLIAYFRDNAGQGATGYDFSELSDGQRMLIALYSLLYATDPTAGVGRHSYTLCLDAPENFLALPEIQPWLVALYERCIEGTTQALIISHHPGLIDYLLASPVGYWFEHQSGQPTRVKPISGDDESGLPASELVARGWLNV